MEKRIIKYIEKNLVLKEGPSVLPEDSLIIFLSIYI